MNAASESAEANAALVRESYEVLNAGDTERLLAVVAPDIVMHYAGMPEPLQGRETWLRGFETMKRAFPDLETQVDELVAADDQVAAPSLSTRSGSAHRWFCAVSVMGGTMRCANHLVLAPDPLSAE